MPSPYDDWGNSKKISELTAQLAALTAERDALAGRLGEAEGLLREIVNKQTYEGQWVYLTIKEVDELKAFLNPSTPPDAKPCKYCGTLIKDGRCSFCAVAGRPEVKPELKFDAKPEMVSEETCDICHGQGFLYCGNCYVDDDFIVVRREDLETAVILHEALHHDKSWYGRLKAALGGEK